MTTKAEDLVETALVIVPIVDEFRAPDTGRLDSQRIAAALGVPLATLAIGLRVAAASLSRRPAPPAAQRTLRRLELGWAGLRRVLGSNAAVRAWLHTARPELEGQAPIDLLRKGSAQALADYVESVLVGQPM